MLGYHGKRTLEKEYFPAKQTLTLQGLPNRQ